MQIFHMRSKNVTCNQLGQLHDIFAGESCVKKLHSRVYKCWFCYSMMECCIVFPHVSYGGYEKLLWCTVLCYYQASLWSLTFCHCLCVIVINWAGACNTLHRSWKVTDCWVTAAVERWLNVLQSTWKRWGLIYYHRKMQSCSELMMYYNCGAMLPAVACSVYHDGQW